MILDRLTFEQCVAQGVGPLVFPERLANESISAEERAQMKMVCMQNIRQQAKMHHVFLQAWNALEQAGIQAVVLKGAGLAAFYPEPEQRAWGDIDLYVGKEQYHAAAAVMRKTFPDALKFDEELDHYKHYNLIANDVSIEVHRVSASMGYPSENKRYARIEEEGLSHPRRLETGDGYLNVPEPTFNALFVLLHAWEHMLTHGAVLRQMVDLKYLLQHEKAHIDAARLKRYLKALHLMDVWQLFTYIMVHELDLDQEDAFFYSDRVSHRAEALLRDLIEGKLIAPKSGTTAPKNRFARKWHTMQERMLNVGRMRQYSPAYARHMRVGIWLSGLSRLFAKDRHWE